MKMESIFLMSAVKKYGMPQKEPLEKMQNLWLIWSVQSNCRRLNSKTEWGTLRLKDSPYSDPITSLVLGVNCILEKWMKAWLRFDKISKFQWKFLSFRLGAVPMHPLTLGIVLLLSWYLQKIPFIWKNSDFTNFKLIHFMGKEVV